MLPFVILALVCAVNFGISWWNAYVCGKVWNESKQRGGFFRMLVWCAAIQSGLGFSGVYIIVFLGAATPFLSDMRQEEIRQLWDVTLSMWYLLIIFPLLGSGLVITVHSWMEVIRNRSYGNMAVAGWNTFAQASNTFNAVRGVGSAFRVVVGGIFSFGGNSKSALSAKGLILMILIVLTALMSGALTTALLIKRYSRTEPVLGRAKATT